jgi:hypothetical protein
MKALRETSMNHPIQIRAVVLAVGLLVQLIGQASGVEQLTLKAAIAEPGAETPETYVLTWSIIAGLANRKNLAVEPSFLPTRQQVRAALESGEVDIAMLPDAEVTRSRYLGDRLPWAPDWVALVSLAIPRDRMRQALAFVSLAASFTEPPLVPPTDPEGDEFFSKLGNDNLLLRNIAEDAALLLSDNVIRTKLFQSMQKSTARQNRISFREFLRQTRSLTMDSSPQRVVHDKLTLILRQVTPLMLYFPVDTDRKRWNGGPELLVAFDNGLVELSRHQTINGIDTEGKRNLLQLLTTTLAKQSQTQLLNLTVSRNPVLAVARCNPPGPNSVNFGIDKDVDEEDGLRARTADSGMGEPETTEGCLSPQPRDSVRIPPVPPNTVINTQFRILKDHNPWFRGADNLMLFVFMPGRTLHIDYGVRQTSDGLVTTNRALYQCLFDRAPQLAGFVWLDEDWIIPDLVGEVLIDCGTLSGQATFTAADIAFTLVKSGPSRKND